MGKRGPAPNPNTEEKVIKSFSFPRSLWEEIEAHVRSGERSRLVQECLRRAAQRRKRDAAEEAHDA